MSGLRYRMVLFIIIGIALGVFFMEGYNIQVTENSYDQVKDTSCPSTKLSAIKMNDLIQADDAPLRYVHPFNSSIVAKKKFSYNRTVMKTVKQVIGDLVRSYEKRPVVLACGVTKLPKLVPVTGISSSHFLELTANIIPEEKIRPHKKIVVYDLGLKQQEIYELKSLRYVEYRKFDFSRFPEHVRNLHTYAFKPLIVAETLAEFGGIMWMDSSISFYQNYSSNKDIMDRMIEQKTGVLFYIRNARHSIGFATHKQMFEYLPMGAEEETKMRMTQAGGMILFNTAHVLKHIMKWAILCSLSQDCIAPKKAIKKCDFSRAHFANVCHRYDQSMFSILVSNAYSSEPSRYRLKPKLYPANVHRLRKAEKKRLKLKKTLSYVRQNRARSLNF